MRRPKALSRVASIGVVSAGPDQRASVDGTGISTFQDEPWRRRRETDEITGLSSPLLATDGTTWALAADGVAHHDGTGWTRHAWNTVGAPPECLTQSVFGVSIRCSATHAIQAPDGSIWLGFGSDGIMAPAALRRYDGESWTDVPDPFSRAPYAVTHLASYGEGPVWALAISEAADDPRQADEQRARLLRWDGTTWTAWELPTWLGTDPPDQSNELVAGPDATVWFSRPLTSFDGGTWRRFKVPSRARSGEPMIEDLSIGPGGSAWMVVRDKVKYKTTRADGIYVLDPTRARAAAEVEASPSD